MSTCTCGSLCVGGTGANACNAVANACDAVAKACDALAKACDAVDNRNCRVKSFYACIQTHTHTQQYSHNSTHTHTHTHTHTYTHTHTHNTHYLLGKKSFSLGVTLRICVMPASLNGPSRHATTTPPMNTPCSGFRV